MKYVLILMFFAVVACSRGGSNDHAFDADPVSGSSSGTNSLESKELSGTWYILENNSKLETPEGVQISFSKNYFTLQTVKVAQPKKGLFVPVIETFTGTYTKNGEHISLNYQAPDCMVGSREKIDLVKASEQNLEIYGARFNSRTVVFTKGDMMTNTGVSGAIHQIGCYQVSEKVTKDRKPANIKGSK